MKFDLRAGESWEVFPTFDRSLLFALLNGMILGNDADRVNDTDVI